MIALFNLVLGIVSGKYIGLEGILTFQLMYYSQLLISPWEQYPIGF
jgi:hypothetical protein